MKSLNVNIDEDLHRRLKLAAFTAGVTIRDFVRDLIEKGVSKNERRNNVDSSRDAEKTA